MAFKAVFAFCASALLVQCAFGQCLGRIASPAGLAAPGLAAPGWAYEGLAGAYGAGCGGVASTGGGLPVASASPIPPVGVSVVSENVYEGALAAGGNLPFLGTVALEGVLPTIGAGAVSYGCGNGAVGIAAEEGPIATGIAPYGAGIAAPAFGGIPAASGMGGLSFNGLAGIGYGPASCGLGALY